MNFDLSEEQQMLVQGAQRYVTDTLGVESRRAVTASPQGFIAEHWRAYADMGWLALMIPENAEGLGGSDVDLSLLCEELGRGLSVDPFVDTTALGTTLIDACEDQPLRSELYASIATGDYRMALAHVEADGRSEYDTEVNTRALQTPQGWQLNGTKQRVFHGAAASHWLVTARIKDDAAPGVFLVDAQVSGVTCHDYALIDGTHACDLILSNTPARLLLQPEQFDQLELALDRTVVALSAAALGSMEAVMTMTADYLKQRTQFGQTLSKFQALQHRMSEMFIEADQARSMLYQALAGLQSTDVAHRGRSVSAAKWLITRALTFIAGQGIQLHGGIGITEEFAVGHHYKSMLVYDKRFGDAQFHLNRSAGLAGGPR